MVNCPTPAKDAHANRADAVESAAHAIVKRGGYLRIYLCVCGAWHLTKTRRDRAFFSSPGGTPAFGSTVIPPSEDH